MICGVPGGPTGGLGSADATGDRPAPVGSTRISVRRLGHPAERIGDLLIVRKRGTSVFMLPGGKVDAGESHARAAVREVAEEVGLALDPATVEWLGRWTAPAANEPGWTITSDVFTAPHNGEPGRSGEIEEFRCYRRTI